jgi:hypothetical protein
MICIKVYSFKFIQQLVEALVDDVVKGRPYFFAKLLHLKLQKLLEKDSNEDAHKDVQRILLSRFEIDLVDIEYEFNQHFAQGKDLEQVILGIKSDKPTRVSGYVDILKLAKEKLNQKVQKIQQGGKH